MWSTCIILRSKGKGKAGIARFVSLVLQAVRRHLEAYASLLQRLQPVYRDKRLPVMMRLGHTFQISSHKPSALFTGRSKSSVDSQVHMQKQSVV